MPTRSTATRARSTRASSCHPFPRAGKPRPRQPETPESSMRFTLAAFAAAAVMSSVAAPTPAPRPLVPLYDAAVITQAREAGLAAARAAIAAIGGKKGPAAIFDEWNRLPIQIQEVLDAVDLP